MVRMKGGGGVSFVAEGRRFRLRVEGLLWSNGSSRCQSRSSEEKFVKRYLLFFFSFLRPLSSSSDFRCDGAKDHDGSVWKVCLFDGTS